MLINMNTRLFRMLAAAIPLIRHYLILMSHFTQSILIFD